MGALYALATIIGVIFILYMKSGDWGKGITPSRHTNVDAANEEIDALKGKISITEVGDEYKRLGQGEQRKKLEGKGYQSTVLFVIFGLLIVGVVVALLSYYGINLPQFGQPEVCKRYVSQDTYKDIPRSEAVAGDVCDNKVLEATAAPTITPYATTVATQSVEIQSTPAIVYTTSPDQYGNAISIWKSDHTVGETGSFWQPLSASGIQFYRDNGLVVAEQTCGQAIPVAQIYNFLNTAQKVSNVSVVVNLTNMSGVNPTVTFEEGYLSVNHPLGCVYTIVYYP